MSNVFRLQLISTYIIITINEKYVIMIFFQRKCDENAQNRSISTTEPLENYSISPKNKRKTFSTI